MVHPPARIFAPLLLLASTVALAQTPTAGPPPAPAPATQPRPLTQDWSASAFDYQRPAALVYAESTPDRTQINWRARPPIPPPMDIVSSAEQPRPAAVGSMRITHLRFRSVNGDVVPALLALPADQPGPFPVVIAIHGLGSYKAQVLAQVGPALVRRGFAVLAPDMPQHGERPGDLREVMRQRNLLQAATLYHQAVVNVRECIDLAEQHPAIDTARGVFLAGYSMGSWINSIAGPADPRVRAMVLMVGGAVPMAPLLALVPQATAVDPMRAIAHFGGRPLLMLNAQRDQTVTPEMGRRLFTAAAEPKLQKWYPSGHRLPQQAYSDAAAWLADIHRDLQVESNPSAGNETGPTQVKALP